MEAGIPISLSKDMLYFRCCKLDIHSPEANFWEDLESKIMESIRNTLDRRVQFYEDEIRKLSEQRLMPIWNFCNFFILKVILVVVLFSLFWQEVSYDSLGAAMAARRHFLNHWWKIGVFLSWVLFLL